MRVCKGSGIESVTGQNQGGGVSDEGLVIDHKHYSFVTFDRHRWADSFVRIGYVELPDRDWDARLVVLVGPPPRRGGLG